MNLIYMYMCVCVYVYIYTLFHNVYLFIWLYHSEQHIPHLYQIASASASRSCLASLSTDLCWWIRGISWGYPGGYNGKIIYKWDPMG